MTALSAATQLWFQGGIDPIFQEFPVKASATIYEGSAICEEAADGYARPVAASLTNPVFLGFAERDAAGGASSGTYTVLTRCQGIIRLASSAISTVAITDLGATIYMSDDATFTKTSTNNVAIGKLINLVGSFAYVLFQAGAVRSI